MLTNAELTMLTNARPTVLNNATFDMLSNARRMMLRVVGRHKHQTAEQGGALGLRFRAYYPGMVR